MGVDAILIMPGFWVGLTLGGIAGGIAAWLVWKHKDNVEDEGGR